MCCGTYGGMFVRRLGFGKSNATRIRLIFTLLYWNSRTPSGISLRENEQPPNDLYIIVRILFVRNSFPTFRAVV